MQNYKSPQHVLEKYHEEADLNKDYTTKLAQEYYDYQSETLSMMLTLAANENPKLAKAIMNPEKNLEKCCRTIQEQVCKDPTSNIHKVRSDKVLTLAMRYYLDDPSYEAYPFYIRVINSITEKLQ